MLVSPLKTNIEAEGSRLQLQLAAAREPPWPAKAQFA
jgi:hypothetical protein